MCYFFQVVGTGCRFVPICHAVHLKFLHFWHVYFNNNFFNHVKIKFEVETALNIWGFCATEQKVENKRW